MKEDFGLQTINQPQCADVGPIAHARPVYIFLDVDGVLNSLRTCVAFGGYKTEHLDRAAIRLLNHLCGALIKAGCTPRVVISSTWRLKHPDCFWWNDLFETHGCEAINVVGHTEDFHDAEPFRRGREVAAWMAAWGRGEPYVCLDDDSDFMPGQPLVLTSHLWGLGCDEIDEAFRLLTGEHLFMSTLRTDSKWKAVRAVVAARAGPRVAAQVESEGSRAEQ